MLVNGKHVSVYYFTHGCRIVKAPMSMFCLAIIYRQREISYKSVWYPCMSKAGSKGMAGMVMAIPIFMYFTAPRSHTSKRLPISMHAATS